jgi:site-specific recombinase XerD
MKLSVCIHLFFDQYLPRIKGVRNNTIHTYRDTFTLFLPFAAKHLSVKLDSLRLEHLSVEVILEFLDYLGRERKNVATTRNQRLAALKSMAKMVRFMYPEKRQLAEAILSIPQKRTRKPLIGFLHQEETLKVFRSVELKKKEGFRDYTLLHLLYDSGARASEIASLNLQDFEPQQRTLIILGKGNRYRQIELWHKTTQLLNRYIAKYRRSPKTLYRNRLFINQRGQELTRHGIYRICQKHLALALPPKRLIHLDSAHCFRHSCAVFMLSAGFSVADIRNRLGHEDIQSTMVYLHLDISHRREIQKRFIEYTQSALIQAPEIEDLIDWEKRQQTLSWLDSL